MCLPGLARLEENLVMVQQIKNWFAWRKLTAQPGVQIGPGVRCKWKTLRVPRECSLILGAGTYIEAGCQILFEKKGARLIVGNDCYLGPSKIVVAEEIVIHDHVYVSWGCTLIDTNSHSLDAMERRKDMAAIDSPWVKKNWAGVKTSPIILEKDSWICFQAIILKGVRVGRGAVVGAGAVVAREVPAGVVVAGNPAEVVRIL